MTRVSVTDDRGQRLALAEPPSRIVSLVPSDTYTLVRLGAGGLLVGRTRYCLAPAGQVDSIEVVGGVRDPDVPRIIALEPDVVIANREDTERRTVEGLEAAGVPVLVSHPTSARAGIEHAARLAELLPEHPAGKALLGEARHRVERFERRRVRPIRTLVPVWMDPLMAVGPGSFAADLLSLVGAEAVVAHAQPAGDVPAERYPRLSLDEVAALQPELVLLPDEPYAFSDAEAEIFRTLGRTGAAGHCPEVRPCDGKDLFWYGLRAVEGLDRLSALLDAVRAGYSTTMNR